MRYLLLLSLSVAMLFLSACSSTPDELKPAELVDFKPEVSLKKEWSRSISNGQGKPREWKRLQPVLIDNFIVAASDKGVVVKVDANNGKVVWKHKVKERLSAAVSGNNKRVFVVTDSGDLIALSFVDGEELWRKPVGSEVLSPPGVNQSVAVLLTASGEIKAYNTTNGDIVWKLTTPVPILTLRGTATPVVDGEAVYIALSNGRLLSFNAIDGKLLWQYRVGVPNGASEIEQIVDILGRPVIDSSTLYITSYQDRLIALDKTNGRPLWEKDVSSYTSPSYGFGHVYITSEEGTLSAVNQRTGQLDWEKITLFRRGLTAPKAWGNYVAVGDFEGRVHLFAQSDGRLVGRKKTDDDGIRAEFLIFNKMLIVFTNNGELHALRIEQES